LALRFHNEGRALVTLRSTEIPLNGSLSWAKDIQKSFPVSLGACYGVSEEQRSIRKTYIHFEQVPIEVVEKILEQQAPVAKRAVNGKRIVKKSAGSSSGRHTPYPEKLGS
jgi:hypothetical protein